MMKPGNLATGGQGSVVNGAVACTDRTLGGRSIRSRVPGNRPDAGRARVNGSRRARETPASFLQWMALGDQAGDRGQWTASSPSGNSSGIFLRRYPDKPGRSELRDLARQAVGQEVWILFPLSVGGQRMDYVFRLKVTDARAYRTFY